LWFSRINNLNMNNLLYVGEALGSLINLTPKPKKLKIKRHQIELKYDFMNSNVLSAWQDTSVAIGEAYAILIADDLVPVQKKLVKKFQQENSYIVDIGNKIKLRPSKHTSISFSNEQ